MKSIGEKGKKILSSLEVHELSPNEKRLQPSSVCEKRTCLVFLVSSPFTHGQVLAS